MKNIFVICIEIKKCGHGDSTSYPVLEQLGTHGWDWKGWCPAFESQVGAEQFIKATEEHDEYKASRMTVKKLELLP